MSTWPRNIEWFCRKSNNLASRAWLLLASLPTRLVSVKTKFKKTSGLSTKLTLLCKLRNVGSPPTWDNKSKLGGCCCYCCCYCCHVIWTYLVLVSICVKWRVALICLGDATTITSALALQRPDYLKSCHHFHWRLLLWSKLRKE